MAAGRNVLLVDSDAGARRRRRRVLEEQPPYDVTEAQTAAEGRAALQDWEFDCLVIDHHLPDSNGLELLRRIREEHGESTPPAILLANGDLDPFCNEATDLGNVDCFVKDTLEGPALRSSIHHAIERSRLARELRAARRRAQFLATHCSLSRLPNRYVFEERLRKAIASAKAESRNLAVLFVDLDRFQVINDTFGHIAGDEMLRTIAARVRNSQRASDTVARLGGDEFGIVLASLKRPMDAAHVARRILDRVSGGFRFDERELVVTASVGMAVFPDDGEDENTLMGKADVAMLEAKRDGGNQYRFYSKNMVRPSAERVAFEAELRRACARRQLELDYQPKVHAESAAIMGCEALVRWRHPRMGRILPEQFIALAEETGLIGEIGEWVIREAARQNAAWQREGLPAIPVSVNVSTRQFWQEDFPSRVETILEQSGLEPHYLELEITESCLARDVVRMASIVSRLAQLGVRVSIDDFGTGFSSLRSLQFLPLDVIKIDRSFIADVTESAKGGAITAGLIALANSLELETVAEGVENEAQLEFLREHGCPVVQGFLFSHPLPPDAFRRLLEKGRIELKSEAEA